MKRVEVGYKFDHDPSKEILFNYYGYPIVKDDKEVFYIQGFTEYNLSKSLRTDYTYTAALGKEIIAKFSNFANRYYLEDDKLYYIITCPSTDSRPAWIFNYPQEALNFLAFIVAFKTLPFDSTFITQISRLTIQGDKIDK